MGLWGKGSSRGVCCGSIFSLILRMVGIARGDEAEVIPYLHLGWVGRWIVANGVSWTEWSFTITDFFVQSILSFQDQGFLSCFERERFHRQVMSWSHHSLDTGSIHNSRPTSKQDRIINHIAWVHLVANCSRTSSKHPRIHQRPRPTGNGRSPQARPIDCP